MTASSPGAPDPARAAWLGFIHGALLGYALTRLLGLAMGEPDPRVVVVQAHVALYWRLATALWWGALAAGFAARFPAMGPRLEGALPWVVLGTVVVLLAVP